MRKTKEMMDGTHKRNEKAFIDHRDLEDEPTVDRCPECGSPDCNGECFGDDMMGASS